MENRRQLIIVQLLIGAALSFQILNFYADANQSIKIATWNIRDLFTNSKTMSIEFRPMEKSWRS